MIHLQPIRNAERWVWLGRLLAFFLAVLAGTAQGETLFIEGTQFRAVRVSEAHQVIERASFSAAISENGEWQVRTHYPLNGVEQTVGSVNEGLYSYTSAGARPGDALVFRSEREFLRSMHEFPRVIWAAFTGANRGEAAARPLPLWAPRNTLLAYEWVARTNTAPPYLADRIDFILKEERIERRQGEGAAEPRAYAASQTWDPVYQTIEWTNVGGWAIPREGRFDYISFEPAAPVRRHAFIVTNAWVGSETKLRAVFAPNSSITYQWPNGAIHVVSESGELLSLKEALAGGVLSLAAPPLAAAAATSPPPLFELARAFLLLWILLPALGAWRVSRKSVKEMRRVGGFRNLPLLLLGDAGRKMNR